MIIDWQNELAREGSRVVVSGLPIAMHCHHYNINLQKTLEDTLGQEGVELIYQAAEQTSFSGFQSFLGQYKRLKTVKSKLEVASILYQNFGMGIIWFQDIGPEGGRIVSPSSHHVTGWLAKHGRRKTPGCHFSRGWIAGVLGAIFDYPAGYYNVEEIRCKMMRDEKCVFEVQTCHKECERSDESQSDNEYSSPK